MTITPKKWLWSMEHDIMCWLPWLCLPYCGVICTAYFLTAEHSNSSVWSWCKLARGFAAHILMCMRTSFYSYLKIKHLKLYGRCNLLRSMHDRPLCSTLNCGEGLDEVRLQNMSALFLWIQPLLPGDWCPLFMTYEVDRKTMKRQHTRESCLTNVSVGHFWNYLFP